MKTRLRGSVKLVGTDTASVRLRSVNYSAVGSLSGSMFKPKASSASLCESTGGRGAGFDGSSDPCCASSDPCCFCFRKFKLLNMAVPATQQVGMRKLIVRLYDPV